MFTLDQRYDVVVIGSGHAGIEAALASARLGCRTLMLTQNLDTIGQMSCNPAIGGLGKSHLVSEIDALGGAMGENADATGIHFRVLNRSKGRSVRALRIQCDKKAYQFRLKALLEGTNLLDVKQATVLRIVTAGARVARVETDIGTAVEARAIVMTSGTFLRGLLHVGSNSKPGGRVAEPTSELSANLAELGFQIGRFKTGTPCRLNRRSIDVSKCEVQSGDDPPSWFSFIDPVASDGLELFTLNRRPFHVEQVDCWLTATTTKTHEIVRSNLDRSPLYTGLIEGIGPRYCPSLEDKVVKFPEKSTHQIFLEPEGLHTQETYVNGASTSLPYDVQVAFIRSIPGLENAQLLRPGYAVEYDYFPPTQLKPSLETKLIEGLFFAGQVNGTSGYEEAAAQGLLAGTNAALAVQDRKPLILPRDQSYIAVMIDDLVTKGATEPYRMFTSRAENRLFLRQDNADVRLTQIGRDIGLVDDFRWRQFCTKLNAVRHAHKLAKETVMDGRPLATLFKQRNFEMSMLPAEVAGVTGPQIWESVAADIKYEGYLARQLAQNAKLKSDSSLPIPKDLDYTGIPGLRSETRQKLAATQPRTLGHAGRISGITPADISIIHIWLIKRQLPSSRVPLR